MNTSNNTPVYIAGAITITTLICVTVLLAIRPELTNVGVVGAIGAPVVATLLSGWSTRNQVKEVHSLVNSQSEKLAEVNKIADTEAGHAQGVADEKAASGRW